MSANLSQEEIDALLKGQTLETAPREKPVPPARPHAARNSGSSVSMVEAPAREPDIRAAVFDELSEDTPVEVPVAGMEVLLDVPLAISVELGRARCFVKDLLNLSSGSVVELDRSAGDAVDILVNGKLFAKGEVVVIDENFGVRIQEIVHRGNDRSGRR